MEAEGRLNRFDIEACLNRQRMRGSHVAILALCTLIMMIDGFDVFIIGKVAPAISHDFGVTADAMTIVFMMQQAGLAAGAFLIGPLGDRYGRRAMLLLSTAAFGLFTIASLFARDLMHFAILRGLAGFFLSGVLPSVIALLSETAPGKLRARFITIAFAGYSAGGVAAVAYTAVALDRYGWQGGFWLGGLLPLAMLPLILFLIPESPVFQAQRNPRDPAIAATLRKLAPDEDLSGVDEFVVATPKRGRVRLAALFEGRMALATALLWATYFFALGSIALLTSWMATLFQELGGIPIQRFAVFSLFGFIGSFAGMLSVGWLMDRFGHIRTLPWIFLLNAAALVALSYLPFGTAAFVAMLIMWQFCQAGGQAGLNAVAAAHYPAGIRSTGVGAAFGSGRIGGVVAPLMGGMAIAMHFSLQQSFWMMATPALAAGLLLFILCWKRPVTDG